jgi:membrane associated rhomboid family serine protease
MVSAPVGWQCPTCLKGAPKVRRMRDIQAGTLGLSGPRPYVTFAIIAACVAAFLAQSLGTEVENRFDIVASGVARGEWYRLFTNGFLHVGLLHILFNMLLLLRLGAILESRVGRLRFAAIYVLSLLGGSLGALLLQSPNRGAIGASGAVFGLMGAIVAMSGRNRTPIDQGVGGLLVANLILSFVIPNLSIGAHLGGAAAGAVGGLLLRGVGERVDVRRLAGTTAALVALSAGLFLAGRPLADWKCSRASGPTLSVAASQAALEDVCVLPSPPVTPPA